MACLPLLVLAVFCVVERTGDWANPSSLDLMLVLVVGCLAAGSWAVFVDLLAVEQRLGDDVEQPRNLSAYCGFFVIVFFMLYVSVRAEHAGVYDTGMVLVVICLPLLLVCLPALWFSARALKSLLMRAVVLTAFVLATAGIELLASYSSRADQEIHMLVTNSMVMALALTIRLLTWGAQQFCELNQPP